MTKPKAITIDTALRNKVFWVVGTSPESFTNIAIKEKPNEDNRSNTIPLFLSLKVSYLQLYQLFIPYLSYYNLIHLNRKLHTYVRQPLSAHSPAYWYSEGMDVKLQKTDGYHALFST